MFDKELVIEIIGLIEDTLVTLLRRTENINSVNDFLFDEPGGESIKKLDKITNKRLLINYSAVNWKDIMGMRDIIVHHYFDIDADIVFQTLKNDVPGLLSVLKHIRLDLCK